MLVVLLFALMLLVLLPSAHDFLFNTNHVCVLSCVVRNNAKAKQFVNTNFAMKNYGVAQ